jgi:hypothetical protein
MLGMDEIATVQIQTVREICCGFELNLRKSSLSSKTRGDEYYAVGHDEILSALSSYVPRAKQTSKTSSGGREHLIKLSVDELSELNFLFGGVGDGETSYISRFAVLIRFHSSSCLRDTRRHRFPVVKAVEIQTDRITRPNDIARYCPCKPSERPRRSTCA